MQAGTSKKKYLATQNGIQSCSPEMQWLLIKVILPSFHLNNLVKSLNWTLPLVGIIQIVVKIHSGLIWFQSFSQKERFNKTSLIKQYFHGVVLVSWWEGSAQSEVISFRWILELRTVEILPWDGVNTVVSSYANQHPWMEVLFPWTLLWQVKFTTLFCSPEMQGCWSGK